MQYYVFHVYDAWANEWNRGSFGDIFFFRSFALVPSESLLLLTRLEMPLARVDRAQPGVGNRAGLFSNETSCKLGTAPATFVIVGSPGRAMTCLEMPLERVDRAQPGTGKAQALGD